jgi:hypothetical protein
MPTIISEKLDRLYVCKECKKSFLFRSDIIEHEQMTGHNKGFAEVPIDAFAK